MRCIESCEEQVCRPIIYKRYVDDIFATFKSTLDRDLFFTTLNTAHRNLSFTMEIPTSSLPFLDVAVTIQNDTYHTGIYRKPTNTGVLMHYNSMVPTKWKRALVKCFVNRAFKICSSYKTFKIELNKIELMFTKNGYPRQFITSIIDDFMQLNKISDKTYQRGNYLNTKPKIDDCTKKAYFAVPFVGNASIKLQNTVKSELIKHNITIIFTYSTTSVGSYFNLKTHCSKLFKSSVVYKFTCSGDQSVSYIGETKRQLFKRVAEHTKSDHKSAVFDHLYNCTKCQDSRNIMEHFEILTSTTTNNIYSLEALLIKKFRPVLNMQLGPGNGTRTSLSLY